MIFLENQNILPNIFCAVILQSVEGSFGMVLRTLTMHQGHPETNYVTKGAGHLSQMISAHSPARMATISSINTRICCSLSVLIGQLGTYKLKWKLSWNLRVCSIFFHWQFFGFSCQYFHCEVYFFSIILQFHLQSLVKTLFSLQSSLEHENLSQTRILITFQALRNMK